MSTTTQNTVRSNYGGIELSNELHPLSTWFILAIRVIMGGMILFAGLGKVTGDPFDAGGYLANVDSASPASGIFHAMAESAALMDVINVIVPATQLLIGIALIFGVFVRLAALGGTMQMSLFYLGGWEGDWLALFDSTLIYGIVFLALGAFAAGRIGGLDRYIESYRIGEQRLIDRYPALRYVLG